jgi:hypothetical protein
VATKGGKYQEKTWLIRKNAADRQMKNQSSYRKKYSWVLTLRRAKKILLSEKNSKSYGKKSNL